MLRYLKKNIGEFIQSCKKNSVTATLLKIPLKLHNDLNMLPIIIQTNMREEDGIYIFDDSDFRWALPHSNYNKYNIVKNWNNLHDRYQEKLEKGDLLLKIGAATGEDLIRASENVGPNGAIYALEPSPANFECLKKNIKTHEISCAVPENVAASNDTEGELNFLEHNSSHTTHRPLDILSPNDERNYNTTKVPKTTVDKYCESKNINEIKMLSITVNGYEKTVLEGANSMLRRTHYVVLPVLYEDAVMILENMGFKLVNESQKNTGCLFVNESL